MAAKYHCGECAEYNKRSTCYRTGICPYADQMEEFRSLNEICESEMYGKRKRVQNAETGEVFPTISAAERSVNAGLGTMYRALNKPTRTVKGYHWVTV